MIALWALIACSSEPAQVTPAAPAHPTHQGPPPAGPPPGQSRAFKAETTLELIPATNPARSVVLISLDTVRADHLGVYGGRAQTPVLTQFAAQGTRFETALTGFPETCVSHWSMMSGVLPQVHGNIPGNGGSLYQGPTLAELAAEAGLATGAIIGGITLQDGMCGLARGFDHYDDDYAFHRADTRPGEDVTQAAVRWIESQTGPYFAFVHYFDAHSPYTPGPPWDAAYDPDYAGSITGSMADLGIHGGGGGAELAADDLAHVVALYDGELSELDALLAPVLAAAGDDAIVVITADHGESFEHGYYFNHRAGLWDSVLRVPWLMRGPGVPVGKVVYEPVSLIDLLPTVTTLAGLPSDARVQGHDRGSLMAGARARPSPHYAMTDPWMPDPQFAVRTTAHKIIWQADGTLVYDLVRDPTESEPDVSVPSDLADARATHDRSVALLSAHQTAPPQQDRFISQQDRQKLEALGYMDPAGGHRGPQGPPPGGGPPGPPGPPPP